MIIILSIRGLLLNLQKLFKFFLKNLSLGFIIIIFSQILGMYFTSSIILLRLPFKERQVISDIYQLQFKFYQQWNDMFFLISVGFTIILLFIRKRIKSFE